MGSVNISEFEKIVEQFGNDVLRYAYLYLGDRYLAEDVSQQVFLKAYQNMSGFRGDASIKTWLYRITINTCKNVCKSRAYRQRREETPLDVLQEVSDPACEPEDLDLWQEVLALPENYRDVVILKYYKGYDSVEIARILGVSQASVRTRLSRAMAKLRGILEEGGEKHEQAASTQFVRGR